MHRDDAEMSLTGSAGQRALGVEPTTVVGDLRLDAAGVRGDRDLHLRGAAVLADVVSAS